MAPMDVDFAGLRALAEAANNAQSKADALREARDDAIRAAVAADTTRGAQARIASATGLSASAVRKIAGQGADR